MVSSTSIADRRRVFRGLHASGCFLLPNPWDAGSARWLEGLGFRALATTSSGYAWSRARPDNGITLDMALGHLADMVDATSLPINADFEGGFGRDAAGVERSVRLALETGIAGLSIEDSTGDPAQPLRPIPEAVERVRAARRAIDATGGDAILVGRSEGFIAGRPDLEQTVARLRAYADAGADCLYAPGIATREQIVTIVEAVAPKPVNVLVAAAGGWTLASLAELGVRRVSVGGALARVAWAAFERAARLLADEGRFDGFADAASSRDLNSFFASAVQAGSD